jgi:hypothetical protein
MSVLKFISMPLFLAPDSCLVSGITQLWTRYLKIIFKYIINKILHFGTSS